MLEVWLKMKIICFTVRVNIIQKWNIIEFIIKIVMVIICKKKAI